MAYFIFPFLVLYDHGRSIVNFFVLFYYFGIVWIKGWYMSQYIYKKQKTSREVLCTVFIHSFRIIKRTSAQASLDRFHDTSQLVHKLTVRVVSWSAKPRSQGPENEVDEVLSISDILCVLRRTVAIPNLSLYGASTERSCIWRVRIIKARHLHAITNQPVEKSTSTNISAILGQHTEEDVGDYLAEQSPL